MKTARFFSWLMACLLLTAGLALGQDNKHDGEIQDHLNKDLKSDKYNNVQSSVQNGVVTLNGTVDTFAAREKAERKAFSIHNVQGVRDQIEVAGKQVPDDQLRKELSDKLRYDRMSYGFGNVFNNLNIGVQDGYVTLTGQVRDDSDRDSAEQLVASTAGVKGVDNEIQVEKNGVMDDEIRLRVARKIYGDPALRMYAMDPQAPIRIVVENGNVSLYGYVSSEVDKNVAAMRARDVMGVKNVENHLVTASDVKKAEKERDKDNKR